MSECVHENFEAIVKVNRLIDSGLFHADVEVRCAGCGTRMAWIGPPMGMDLYGGAMVSPDRFVLNCRLDPDPYGTSVLAGDHDLKFPRGFSIKEGTSDEGI